MRNTKKAFTLVELIVVITILAILGTIAFISLQGYSSDARNSKRTSDLGSLQSALSTATTKGVSLLSFVSTNGSDLTTINVAGTGAAASNADYKAGTVNYTTLGVKEADFKDPSDASAYVVGATTKIGGKYEFAASVENGSGEKTAKVVGDYNPRTTVETIATTGTGTSSVTISSANANKLVRGDTVTDGTNTLTIVAVSDNLTTLTLSANNSATATGLTLSNAESAGLIGDASGQDDAVVEGGTFLPY